MKKVHIVRQGGLIVALTVIVVFLIVSVKVSPSGPKSELNKVVAGVQKRYEKISTYKVKFKQTLKSPVFKKVIREGSGVIYFAKPGKVRWEYKKPEKRLYLMDGEYFWDYDPSAKQVLKIPIKDALAGDVPHGFLFGAGNLKKDFKLKLLGLIEEGPDAGYRLSLEPRDKDLKTIMTSLELTINAKQYTVEASSFTDAQGNINNYLFSNIVMNPKLDPGLFRFKVPRGVKVLLPITKSELQPPKK